MHIDTLRTFRPANRAALWIETINRLKIKAMVEVGVWRGDFAKAILSACPGLERYYMIDPWRPLEQWNKPYNTERDVFEDAYRQAMEKTEFAADRRIVLRGTTLEAAPEIADASLGLAYIDGDHTLRGIAIDLIQIYPKVMEGGIVGGDDFSASIWQHSRKFEPTLVAPYAIYFAEAVQNPILALPFNQFAIEKTKGFDFIGGENYPRDLLPQIAPRKLPE
ncbi:class I SAM-dependent methyltransferase [Shinella daejeonensis]|uniref:class I SAM-dependent methyltransferase n=1 Tax=Shinella daejeonensis TaxID=659017 RepID=UPI0020C74ECF|nr:class I SAM-dependent methyltransferase [Shinella daejeonensis]MCP8893379.1 class I SAM-dependent methyltransferase [Shinella daejeonensis]